MEKDEEGDITTDVCPKCGGVFLDKGELNTLATAMKGNIEYCSIDHDFHKDRFPQRSCPKCNEEQMTKVNLLRLSDLIFDYCPKCEGFFLDKEEIQRMNQELKALTPNKEAEEYRELHGKHIVRIDQTSDVLSSDFLGISSATTASYIRVSVFFDKEMPHGTRVFQESWATKLAKGLGLFFGQDIKTGDSNFDSAFRVQGDDEKTIAEHLNTNARELLISFSKNEKSIYSKTGSLEITSSGVVYVEGPYIPNSINDVVEKSKSLVGELIQMADAIEARQ